mgnify:CR=1 FL=1
MKLQDIKQEYKQYHNGTWIYTIHPGRWSMYRHEADMPGVTIHYQANGPVSTIVYCDNLKRAEELREDLERNRERIHAEQRQLGEYIRTNKLY